MNPTVAELVDYLSQLPQDRECVLHEEDAPDGEVVVLDFVFTDFGTPR